MLKKKSIKYYISKFNRHSRLIFYYLEAVWHLIICKLLIVYRPFKSYAKHYGYPQSETMHETLTHAAKDIEASIVVLRVLPRFLPWKSKCLDQAMAAGRMLKRRNLQHTLYFGLAYTPEKERIAPSGFFLDQNFFL